MGTGSHEGVPGESVGVVDLVQKPAGVVQTQEGGGSGEGKEATCGEGVLDEAGSDHLGVDLEELHGVSAFLEIEFEDGEGNGGLDRSCYVTSATFEGLEDWSFDQAHSNRARLSPMDSVRRPFKLQRDI